MSVADKFNIWNEGSLPIGLTIADLKGEHPSKPRNPIIADVCFKGGYIDSWGSSTLKIIDACKKAELPEPEIIERHGGFSVTIFKDILTGDYLTKLGLNDRQMRAIQFIKETGSISNQQLRELADISKATATRDLTDLVEKYHLIAKKGETGAGTVYILKGS